LEDGGEGRKHVGKKADGKNTEIEVSREKESTEVRSRKEGNVEGKKRWWKQRRKNTRGTRAVVDNGSFKGHEKV
jgi:hypothetical protein